MISKDALSESSSSSSSSLPTARASQARNDEVGGASSSASDEALLPNVAMRAATQDTYSGLALAPPHSNAETLAAIHNAQIRRSSFGNTSASLNNIDLQTRLLLLQQSGLLGAAAPDDAYRHLAIAAQQRALEPQQQPQSNLPSILHPSLRADDRASATMPQLQQQPNRTNTSRMLFRGNLIGDQLLGEQAIGVGRSGRIDAEQTMNALLQQQRDDQNLLALLQLQQRQQMRREGSDRMQLEQLIRTSSSSTAATSMARRGLESGGLGTGPQSISSLTSLQLAELLQLKKDQQLLRQLRTDETLRSEAASLEQRHLLTSLVSGYPSMPSFTGGAGLTGSGSSTLPLLQQNLRLQMEGAGSPLSSLDHQNAYSPFYVSYQDHVRRGTKRRAEYIQMEAQNETAKRRSLPDDKGLKMDTSISSRSSSSLSQGALPPTTKKSNDQTSSGKPKAKAVKSHHEANDEVDEVEQEANAEVAETTSIETFPHILYRMLYEIEEEGNAHIVSFFPHGCSFGIHKPKQFVNNVLPKYFTTGRMSSFQRQLNLYSFRRITDGPEKGGYWHENFLKNCPALCKNIARKKATSKATTNPSSTSIQSPPAAAMSAVPLSGTALSALPQMSRYGSSSPSMVSTQQQGRQPHSGDIIDSNILDDTISQLLPSERLRHTILYSNTRQQLQQRNQSGQLNEQLLSSILMGDVRRNTGAVNMNPDQDLIHVVLRRLMEEQEQQRQRQQQQNNANNNP